MTTSSSTIRNGGSHKAVCINTDFIIMTPYPIEPGHTLLNIVRVKANKWSPELRSAAAHIAEGENAGIVINKPSSICVRKPDEVPNFIISFKVYLLNSGTNRLTLEYRKLKFWFQDHSANAHSLSVNNNNEIKTIRTGHEKHQLRIIHSKIAHDFFTNLIANEQNNQFPRNYVGFIMRVMRLLKHQFTIVDRMELELQQLPNDEIEQPPSRMSSLDGSTGEELNCQRVLDIIESSYPDPVSIQDICSSTKAHQDEVRQFVNELASQKKISSLDGDLFARSHAQQSDTKINVVKQMPKVIQSKQPVIAIITSQYCEKLAVDTMISNKDTYFRYKTEGETSNYVYTLGNIGEFRVVSTKLPAVGNSRNALIAAGNTTTRLLGTFPQLEYIFLIGCSGGVANYTDFSSHVRLGDIVVSSIPNQLESSRLGNGQQDERDYIYVHCEEHSKKEPSSLADTSNELDGSTCCLDNYHFRFWRPPNLQLQKLAKELWSAGIKDDKKRCWEKYIDEGIELLKDEDVDVSRPSHDTDKLYMSLGVNDVIEVNHPEASERDIDLRKKGRPMCHFGPIGSGRAVVKNDALRQNIIGKFGALAFDSEFDAVLDSIYGNRKDSYIFIRGISDYRDGRKKKEWQQYSALVAAAFMKSLIVNLLVQNSSNP